MEKWDRAKRGMAPRHKEKLGLDICGGRLYIFPKRKGREEEEYADTPCQRRHPPMGRCEDAARKDGGR